MWTKGSSKVPVFVFGVVAVVVGASGSSRAMELAVPMTSADQVVVERFQPAICQGKVVFAGNDPDRGAEPWVTDGTPAGTKRLKDIWPGPRSSSPHGFAALGNRVLFWAEDAAHGRELWITDGTEAGTIFLKDITPGEQSGDIRGCDPNSYETGFTAVFNGSLYFFATKEGGGSSAVYRTDGTPEGTIQLFAIDRVPGELITGEDGVYVFSCEFGAEGFWKTDGSPQGTVFVAKSKKLRRDSSSDFSSPDREMSWRPVCIERTVFFASQSKGTGVELWKSDGTDAGTVMIRDIRKGFGPGYDEKDRCSYPQWLTALKNQVYFAATDDVDTDRGRELWKTDGTEAGTVMVKDINPGRGSSAPSALVVCNNTLYFTAHSNPKDTYERTLWSSDGTEKGTVMVRNLSYLPNPPADRSLPQWPLVWPVAYRGSVFTVVNPFDGGHGVCRMQPGSNVLTVLHGMPKSPYHSKEHASGDNENPRWIFSDNAIIFVSNGRLWRCAAPNRQDH